MFGQFEGYRDEAGVSPHSEVETYAALRLQIDSWRWSGVPWFIRTGKCLGHTALEAVVELRPAPTLLFAGEHAPVPRPNLIRFRLGKDAGVDVSIEAKRPGRAFATKQVDLDVFFESTIGLGDDAYERLLDDIFAGDPRRFARQDTVEEAWRVVEPLLGASIPAYPYEAGSMGPQESTQLLGPHRWHDPRRRKAAVVA